jgi:ribosome biogenesis protein Tsr3
MIVRDIEERRQNLRAMSAAHAANPIDSKTFEGFNCANAVAASVAAFEKMLGERHIKTHWVHGPVRLHSKAVVYYKKFEPEGKLDHV